MIEHKLKNFKVTLAVLAFALAFILLSCTDSSPVILSGEDKHSSSSVESSSSAEPSSSSVKVASSSSTESSSSSNLCDGFVDGTIRKHFEKMKPQFCDERDGKKYVYVGIGTQTWMAENLNYATASGSWCYGNNDANCTIYGRLYDWATVNTVCPSGWHLPSDTEWAALMQFVNHSCPATGDCTNAGKFLKAASGWNDYNGNSGNGTDNHGFSALPGGGYYHGSFNAVRYYGYWWGVPLRTTTSSATPTAGA